MSGKVSGQEYDKEFRNLYHQYNMSSQAIPGFQGLDKFVQV